MADDLQANLSNYKLQFQQVEAALTLDPDSEDLKKLKNDLKEVLDLTEELIRSQEGAVAAAAVASETVLPGVPSTAPSVSHPEYKWKVGDRCVAVWSEDQGSYEATIEEILDDGSCTVTFDGWGNTDVTQISLLLPIEQAKKRSAEEEGGSQFKPKTKRDKMAAEREYKKKKAQKKANRQKQLDEERESEKNKWLNFNAKTFSKTTKGRVKKSIFATPESVSGRVGVGTCGQSGKPMTSFAQHEKWKK